MKNLHTHHEAKILIGKRFVFYFGEDVHTAEIAKKAEEKKAEAEKKKVEAEENKPEKLNKLKTRYSGERANELIQCDLLKKSDSVDPYQKDLATKKEKRIKDETVEPDKLEGKYLTGKEVNDNMRKLYKILGKDWDQIKADEEKKEKEEKEKPKPPTPEAKPPEKQELLTRVKFATLERIASSVDKNADANTKEAITAVMNVIQQKAQGIEFSTSDELIKTIVTSINGLNEKHLAALAGKDINLKADQYNISFKFLKAGESPTRKFGIESAFVGKQKPPEQPKPPEDKSKPAEDKSKPVESKEITELRSAIEKQAKDIFESYSKMSKEDLIKQGLNNGNKLSYEIGVRINNISHQFPDKLAKLDKTYVISDVYPKVGDIGFNKNGVFNNSLGPFILSLYADKKIEDSTAKEMPNALEYLKKYAEKVDQVTKKFEDKAYVDQLGITTFEEYTKKYEQEVTTAVGTIDKKLIAKIEWKKLEYKTLNNSIASPCYFRMEEGKEPTLSPHIGKLRQRWEKLNPPAKEEPASKEDQPKAPVEEKPDPAKFNKIRPTQEAAINRGLALSYEGTMYNDPIGIGMAIKLQLQKLPIREQYLIPTHYMTPQGIKLQMLYYGDKMQVKVVGVTETVARKYTQKWEELPRASAEENEKKWAKIKCVDVYGTEKPKPEGWLKTKEGARLEKEEADAKAKKEAESKSKEPGAKKPEEKVEPQEAPEVKEARNKVEAGMKKIFDNVSKMSKEELSAKGVFNILHEMSVATKILEKDLAPDLAKLDKTYQSDKVQPPILIYFNKSGINMEKPGQWVNDQLTAKGAVDSVDGKSPNAFSYTQLFTSKMVELRGKYSDKKFLTEQGINSPEDLSKKFQQELSAIMEKTDPKMIDKIEWANFPGQTLVYPSYSYASFRLEKGKKVAVSANEAGMRTLWDKANAPKPAFEASTQDEKPKEDSQEQVEKAKAKVDEEVKVMFKKYIDMPAETLVSEKLNNRTLLINSLMNDIKSAEGRLRSLPEIKDLNQSHNTESIPKVVVSFNKYGLRPIGLNDWVNSFYKGKKIEDTEKKETPNARKAEEKIIETINKVNEKYSQKTDKEALKKLGVENFGQFYKFMTDATKKEIDALDPAVFANIEWDKLPNKTFKSPYTFFVEVKRDQNSKESQYTFNYAMYKTSWDNQPDKREPEESKDKKPPSKPAGKSQVK